MNIRRMGELPGAGPSGQLPIGNLYTLCPFYWSKLIRIARNCQMRGQFPFANPHSFQMAVNPTPMHSRLCASVMLPGTVLVFTRGKEAP